MTTLRIVCCYAPEDKKLMESFHAHLRALEIQHVSIWYAHRVLPGAEWERERDSHLQSAHLILLLVSSDFIGSHELYKKTVLPSMERYERGETRVVPIILRPVHWQETPFGKLQPLPEGGKPVTDRVWKTLDHAFFDVVRGIKRIIDNEKPRLLAQQENDDFLHSSEKSTSVTSDAVTQLEQIIQGFKSLREQIASAVFLKGPQGFSVESCESQYNRLYGDTIVLLATYLPQLVSTDEEGFVEAIYRKAATQLQQRSNFSVWLARRVIAPLAELEKLAMQIDACVTTLELYKQEYFMVISD
jgi:TIR domain